MDMEKVIKGLEIHTKPNSRCVGCPYPNNGLCGDQLYHDALAMLKEQGAVVRCEDCENWIPGYITDQDDFIPPKCGKYQQMVGHSSDDFCSLAEKKEGR